MSKKSRVGKYITVSLVAFPELAEVLDNCVVTFGLDSRSQAAAILIKAGASSLPAQTMVYEITRAHLRQLREGEFAAMNEYFNARAKLFEDARR